MQLTPVTSSNIAAIGYDGPLKELHVQFKSGATHIYSGVSAEKYHEFLTAESKGSHFAKHVKGKFESRKVEAKKEP